MTLKAGDWFATSSREMHQATRVAAKTVYYTYPGGRTDGFRFRLADVVLSGSREHVSAYIEELAAARRVRDEAVAAASAAWRLAAKAIRAKYGAVQ